MTDNGSKPLTVKQANTAFLEAVRMQVALRVQLQEQVAKADQKQQESFMALQNAIVEESKKPVGE